MTLITSAAVPSTSKVAPKPLAGWVLSVLDDGDSLALLERLYGVDAVTIAEQNGVAPAPGRAKTCVWGRAVEAWVLNGTPGAPSSSPRGFRRPVVQGQENHCSPGLGFASFAPGQVIRLPPGGPRRQALPQGASSSSSSSSRSSLWMWAAGAAVVLVVGGVAVVALAPKTAHRKAAA